MMVFLIDYSNIAYEKLMLKNSQYFNHLFKYFILRTLGTFQATVPINIQYRTFTHPRVTLFSEGSELNVSEANSNGA